MFDNGIPQPALNSGEQFYRVTTKPKVAVCGVRLQPSERLKYQVEAVNGVEV